MARTEIYTYFTVPDGKTHLLYSAEEPIRLRIKLQTAGPVAIGTREDLGSVLSGGGALLDTGVEQEIILPRGDRMYLAAEAINRLAIVVEPLPYLPQILAALTSIDTGAPPASRPEAPPPKTPPYAPTPAPRRAPLGPEPRTPRRGRRR